MIQKLLPLINRVWDVTEGRGYNKYINYSGQVIEFHDAYVFITYVVLFSSRVTHRKNVIKSIIVNFGA